MAKYADQVVKADDYTSRSNDLRATAKNSDIGSSLLEDLETAWIPDALAWIDLPDIADEIDRGDRGAASPILVPRPSGFPLKACMLSPAQHVALHRSVAHLKDSIDTVLVPEVCGYRRGAESDFGYRDEHRRYSELTAAGLEEHPFILFCDIEAFFSSVTPELVVALIEDGWGEEAASPVSKLFDELGVAGVRLPPGYADTRLLANLVLHGPDHVLGRQFTRWVDDYRIFLDTEAACRLTVARLETALNKVGLRLNRKKTHFESAEDARRQVIGRPLDSVYHPEFETKRQTSAGLRQIFADAAADPVKRRRDIRFVLPRLAIIGDPIAIDFALWGISHTPWELPRIVSYLRKFLDDERVRAAVNEELGKAIANDDEWTFGRLAPLGARIPLSRAAVDALKHQAWKSATPAIWGLAIRLLALASEKDSVIGLLDVDCLEPRAAVAALADLGLSPFEHLQERAPATAKALRERPAPLPLASSIL